MYNFIDLEKPCYVTDANKREKIADFGVKHE